MSQRPLGQTGVNVHPVGLGCMSLSGFYGPTDEAEAMRLLAAGLDLGVNFFDTANVYGEGLSETRIGKFLARGPLRGARRSRWRPSSASTARPTASGSSTTARRIWSRRWRAR